VRAHLEGALSLLQPTALRSARRARLVAELRRYIDEGVFPRNDFSPERAMPAFIDATGTRCAMAFLVENHGGERLVARVAANDNHGFVHGLAVDSDLRAWLDAWELSVDEAARIQPSYCWTAAHCTCKNTSGAQTVLEVVDGKVIKVHGKQGDDKVGDMPDGGYSAKQHGNTFLVVPYFVHVEGRKDKQYEWKQIDNGTVTCAVIDQGVKKEHAIRALLSPKCHETLQAIDPKYTKDCRPFRRHAALDIGAPFGLVATALGAAIWVRRRRESNGD
jgi:hypothetical protein